MRKTNVRSEAPRCDLTLTSWEEQQVRSQRELGFERLLDAGEAAGLLRIHPKTLQRLTRPGRIPAFRVGRFWRYRGSDLEIWLRSSSHSSCQPADRVDFTQEKSQ